MSGTLDDVVRSVVRVPVAGPSPNNTLAFVCGSMEPWFDNDDQTARHTLTFETPFRIDGFTQARARFYLDTTHISVSGYLRTIASDGVQPFLTALDAIEGFITDDGRLTVSAALAEQDDVAEKFRVVFVYSAWILTCEPHPPTFTAPAPKDWAAEQLQALRGRVGGTPPAADNAKTMTSGPHSGVVAQPASADFANREDMPRGSDQVFGGPKDGSRSPRPSEDPTDRAARGLMSPSISDWPKAPTP